MAGFFCSCLKSFVAYSIGPFDLYSDCDKSIGKFNNKEGGTSAYRKP